MKRSDRVPIDHAITPNRLSQGKIWKSGVDFGRIWHRQFSMPPGFRLRAAYPDTDQMPSVHSASLFRTLSGNR